MHGVQNSYRVESWRGFGVLVTRETKLDVAGNETTEWTETWTDGNGRALKTVRSDAGNVNGIPASQSFYNDKGQLERQVDADGVTALFGYNAAGEQIVSAIDMDQSGTISAADRVSSNATSIVPAHGTTVLRRQSWQFGESGPVLVSTSDSTGDGRQSWQISFGLTNSTLTEITDRFHAERTVTSTSPDGSRSVTISEEGRVKSVQRLDAAGTQLSLLTYAYDALGRVVTNSDNRTTTIYEYNAADQQTAVTVAGAGVTAQTTRFDYDSMGRRTNTVMADGAQTHVAYLPSGEVATNWGDRTYPVAYTYDHAGRMKTMTTWQDFTGNTGKAVTTWNYDPHTGQLANKRYQDNLGPDYTYTPAGRLHERTWARGIKTTYAYNNAGDLASVAYSDGTPGVTNTFDLRGRRLSASSAQSAVTYFYSDAGQLLAETHTAGPLKDLTVTNTYDSLLRRSQLAVVSGQGTIVSPITYQYDAASRLSAVGQASLLVQYSYVPGAPGLVSNITFWSAGAPMMKTTKTYDSLNRLTKIESTTGGRPVSSHSYGLNQANQRTKRTDADGSYWDYGYDSLGQVTNAVRKWADGTNVVGQSYSYVFDDIGNRQKSMVDSGGTSVPACEYAVNLLNQYESRTVPGAFWETGHAHSNAAITVAGQTNAVRHGEYFASQLTLANGSSAVYSSLVTIASMLSGTNNVAVTNTGTAFLPKTPEVFTHDADGNLTSDGRWVYSWDAENRLIAMETTAAAASNGVPRQKLAFAYDHQSRRISKKVYRWDSDLWTLTSDLLFIYDGWNLLAEVDKTNAVVRSYAWGLDLSGTEQGAGGIGGLLWVNLPQATNTQARGSHFVAFDGNGNVAALLNAQTAQISAEYEYGPFGETIRATGPAANENVFRFSAKYTDAETGLLYYGYRYYQPSTGRWGGRDPIGEGGGNALYRFVFNQPTAHCDPLGLKVKPFGFSFEDLIEGYSSILVLDKHYSSDNAAENWTPYTFGSVLHPASAKWVCYWKVSGPLAITEDSDLGSTSIRVYPTRASVAENDATVTVVTVKGQHTRKVTVRRPYAGTRTEGRFAKRVLAWQFRWLFVDQFLKPLPAGVRVSEVTVNANPGMGSETDANGTVEDTYGDTPVAGTLVGQTIRIGNWEANADHEITGGWLSNYRITAQPQIYFE